MFIVQLAIYTLPYFIYYVIRDQKRPEVQNFEHSYLEKGERKGEIFEKQCKTKVAQNNVILNLLPLKF